MKDRDIDERAQARFCYSISEIKQLVGISERTVRRWTEAGVVRGTPSTDSGDFTYGFQALTLFRQVREMRTQGLTIQQIEAELQGQLSLFGREDSKAEHIIAIDSKNATIVTYTPIIAIDPKDSKIVARLPLNAEYVLYLLLRREERDVVIGDLIEDYGTVMQRFTKRRADIWLYKQILGSLLPLLRRAVLKIGALVWLSRILRRLVP
jgi:DNA-binding transcriptional MerR regulator